MNIEAAERALLSAALAYYDASRRHAPAGETLRLWAGFVNACEAYNAAVAVDPVDIALARIEANGLVETWREPK